MTRFECMKHLSIWELATLLALNTNYDLNGKFHEFKGEVIKANVEWLETNLKGGES